MIRLLKLTQSDGEFYWVHPIKLVYFYRPKDSEYTNMILANGDMLEIKETPEEIIKQIGRD